MPTTIKDIAKRAGVAHTTVSRALRGSPLIAHETSQHIRAIAAELGYYPSAAARSLKTNRSQVIGVIVSHIADPFFSEILQGIDDLAQQSGYSLFIAAAQHDPEREKAIVKTMREHRVDGPRTCKHGNGLRHTGRREREGSERGVGGRPEPGSHEITIDAEGLPSGLYIGRLTAGIRFASVRMTLIR